MNTYIYIYIIYILCRTGSVLTDNTTSGFYVPKRYRILYSARSGAGGGSLLSTRLVTYPTPTAPISLTPAQGFPRQSGAVMEQWLARICVCKTRNRRRRRQALRAVNVVTFSRQSRAIVRAIVSGRGAESVSESMQGGGGESDDGGIEEGGSEKRIYRDARRESLKVRGDASTKSPPPPSSSSPSPPPEDIKFELCDAVRNLLAHHLGHINSAPLSLLLLRLYLSFVHAAAQQDKHRGLCWSLTLHHFIIAKALARSSAARREGWCWPATVALTRHQETEDGVDAGTSEGGGIANRGSSGGGVCGASDNSSGRGSADEESSSAKNVLVSVSTTCIYIYICICIYTHLSPSLSLSLYIYIYICDLYNIVYRV